jgi:hypothetical protein
VNIDQLLAAQRQPAKQEKHRQQDGKGKLYDEPTKLGLCTLCCSAIALIMKLGLLPM